MSAPLIPYVSIPPLHIFGPKPIELLGRWFEIPELSIKPFGTLVAIGVWVGSEAARRTALRFGLDEKKLSSLMFAILVGGFVGGHVFDTLWYYPERAMHDPLSLLRIWDGQSSFGGFTGALLGLVYWKLKHRQDVLAYADVIASAFPLGWVFGRSGCSVAHDHPGMHSDLWFAVQYPGGGRFDLGLYEMLLTIPLAVAFVLLAKKRRPPGFFLGVLCMAYAPTRFGLDFLRAHAGDPLGADARYAGLTPAQWGCFGLLAVGVYFAWRAGRAAERGPEPVAALPDGAVERAT